MTILKNECSVYNGSTRKKWQTLESWVLGQGERIMATWAWWAISTRKTTSIYDRLHSTLWGFTGSFINIGYIARRGILGWEAETEEPWESLKLRMMGPIAMCYMLEGAGRNNTWDKKKRKVLQTSRRGKWDVVLYNRNRTSLRGDG